MKRSHRLKIDEATWERIIGRHQTALMSEDPLLPFNRGDVLWLSCGGPDGRAMMRTVGDVQRGPGVAPGYAMLSLV